VTNSDSISDQTQTSGKVVGGFFLLLEAIKSSPFIQFWVFTSCHGNPKWMVTIILKHSMVRTGTFCRIPDYSYGFQRVPNHYKSFHIVPNVSNLWF